MESKQSQNQQKAGNTSSNHQTQPCPQCGFPIGTRAGSKEAICKNCGFKDPCCE